MANYNREKIPYARSLRKNMTSCERKLWYLFLRSYPIRFQRQKIIGDYIADFYCAKAHLIIEIDGEWHHSPQSEINDNCRTRRIKDREMYIIRFSNEEIENDFYRVCERIDNVVQRIEEKPQTPQSQGRQLP